MRNSPHALCVLGTAKHVHHQWSQVLCGGHGHLRLTGGETGAWEFNLLMTAEQVGSKQRFKSLFE